MKLHRITDKLGDAAEVVAGWFPDALLVIGAGAIAYGAGQVYPPAGWMVGGLFTMLAGWLLAKGGR